ncbi:hypothetical protein AB4254_09010 [Vibrio breoganii]
MSHRIRVVLGYPIESYERHYWAKDKINKEFFVAVGRDWLKSILKNCGLENIVDEMAEPLIWSAIDQNFFPAGEWTGGMMRAQTIPDSVRFLVNGNKKSFPGSAMVMSNSPIEYEAFYFDFYLEIRAHLVGLSVETFDAYVERCSGLVLCDDMDVIIDGTVDW